MSLEGQLLDQKSLRAVTGRTANWNEIAKDCIAFANAIGGRLLLGIEDGQNVPPADQQIPADLPDILRRKLAERTVNVTVLPDVVTASNGGQYTVCRNEHLARLFHDLKLMEREGSGFDKIFEVLVSQGRPGAGTDRRA
nr:ATP-binding protein [Geoalkalibacter sp.]